jgi:hypothetical protein
MRRAIARHWTFLPTGLCLAAVLIAFWALNQSYLAVPKTAVATFLENPIPTFALVMFGAYVAATVSGEFSLKAPPTAEPLLVALGGGVIAGAGVILAQMSLNSAVLFSLAGVFTLPAFMITKGWIYIAFMVLGGLAASRLFVLVMSRTGTLQELALPAAWRNARPPRMAFPVAVGLFSLAAISVFFAPLAPTDRTAMLAAMVLLAIFGFVSERGTICMSSMLKEWFISRTAYAWRGILFTIMCLALLYQLGLYFGLFLPLSIERTIADPLLLVIGSFMMGFGFVFADGCFIGSLWKAAQGNVVNFAGIFGLLIGMGGMQVAQKLLGVTTAAAASSVPNNLDGIIPPWLFLAILWAGGLLSLAIFRPRHYRY